MGTRRGARFALIALLPLLTATACGALVTRGRDPVPADVVVYGCTSAGVAAAVQARRMGRSVVLVGPDRHLGGLSLAGPTTVRISNLDTDGHVIVDAVRFVRE